LSGLGTPNISKLRISLTDVASRANPLSYTLSGAPSDMSIRSSGIVTLPKPVAGTNVVSASIISISDPGVSWIQIFISGAPLGIGFNMSGTTITLNWPSPITGNYTLKVTVLDSANRTAQVNIPVTITAK
jgi:hypothetical protein